MVPDEPAGPPEALRCRVPRSVPALKAGAAVGLLLLGTVFGTDPVRLTLAAVAAGGLLLWAVRDLVVPERLAADGAGVTVIVGFAGRRRLEWSEIERIRVDARPRFGVRTETLEIDTGESLHLFSAYDLGVPPSQVADQLDALRPPASHGEGGGAGHRQRD